MEYIETYSVVRVCVCVCVLLMIDMNSSSRRLRTGKCYTIRFARRKSPELRVRKKSKTAKAINWNGNREEPFSIFGIGIGMEIHRHSWVCSVPWSILAVMRTFHSHTHTHT